MNASASDGCGTHAKSEVFELPTMTQAGYTPPQDTPKRQPPKANPPKKPKKRKKKGGIGTAGVVSLIIFLIAVLIGSGTLFLYAKTEPYSDTFLPGTSVSGYELGGLTAQDGAQAKKPHSGRWMHRPLCGKIK